MIDACHTQVDIIYTGCWNSRAIGKFYQVSVIWLMAYPAFGGKIG
jgi:hypothetical protein